MNMERIVKDFLDLGLFLKFVYKSEMACCIVYKIISHMLLISPFLCPSFFPINKTVMVIDCYFAHWLLYLMTAT